MRRAVLAAALMAGMSGAAMATPALGMQTEITPATAAEVRRAKAQNRPKPKRRPIFPRRLTATDELQLQLARVKRARKAAKLRRDWATYHRRPAEGNRPELLAA